MSKEQMHSTGELSANLPLNKLDHFQTEKPAEKIEKIKIIIEEVERLYQLSTNLESVHHEAVSGLLAAIGTLLREEIFFLETSQSSTISSRTVDATTRELLKQSLLDLGIDLKDSPQL